MEPVSLFVGFLCGVCFCYACWLFGQGQKNKKLEREEEKEKIEALFENGKGYYNPIEDRFFYNIDLLKDYQFDLPYARLPYGTYFKVRPVKIDVKYKYIDLEIETNREEYAKVTKVEDENTVMVQMGNAHFEVKHNLSPVSVGTELYVKFVEEENEPSLIAVAERFFPRSGL